MTANDIVFLVQKMEKKLARFHGVDDVVIVTLQDTKGSHQLKVFVEPVKGDVNIKEENIKKDIEDFCRSNAGDLQFEVILTEIPRTPSGKVARQQLLQMAQ